jgi:hypothetical protein
VKAVRGFESLPVRHPHHHVRLVAAGNVHRDGQGLQIGREPDRPGIRHFPVGLVGNDESALVHSPGRRGSARARVRPPVRIVLAVELQVLRLVFQRLDEREAVVLERLHLNRIGRVHRLLDALPVCCETRSPTGAPVDVIHTECRTVGHELAEIVRERTAVLRELPRRLEQQSTVFLALDDPGVGRFGLHRQQGPAVAPRLVAPIHHDRHGASAKIERVFVAALALNLHLVGHSGLRRIELPLADEGALRRPCDTRRQANRRQDFDNSLEHSRLLRTPRKHADGYLAHRASPHERVGAFHRCQPAAW